MRSWTLAVLGSIMAACSDPADSTPPSPAEQVAALAAVERGQCVRCHPAATADALLPSDRPKVPLRQASAFHHGAALAIYLRAHHGADDSEAIGAYLGGATPAELQRATIAAGSIEAGVRLFGELACIACHEQGGIDGLSRRTDHAHLFAFLREPAARRPDLVHDFALTAGEASALAAFLLRDQLEDQGAAPQPGLSYECFELNVRGAELPELGGLQPAAKGVTDHVDVDVRTRDDQFALRFQGLLLVPQTGEWTLTVGSDDSSWLWVDDVLLIENAQVSPHRRRSATLRLEAGAHPLRIVFTELGGGESLEFLWRGPGVKEEVVPKAALSRNAIGLQPKVEAALAVEPGVRERGARAFAARSCLACHELAGAPELAPAVRKPWRELGDGDCQRVATGRAVLAQARRALRIEPSPQVLLAAQLAVDGCTSCHVRDGQGGLAAEVRSRLAEIEDIGDEGRLPPELTGAGHRLRSSWLAGVLTGEHRVRSYMRARMPRVASELAERLTRAFVVADAVAADDQEPAFDAAMVTRGQQLVGIDGRNCATCHPFAGRRAIGPQGMDLALQHQRLKPQWFADWLLHATTLRPGTRMPAFWFRDDVAARADVAAIRAWCSLGDAAPVPKGYASTTIGLELDPIERPILHGAFLQGLSARCVAVGTPLRGHFAYDLEHARLAWLWRGPFLDASGTWSGRAGMLLKPLADDHVELEPMPMVDVAGGAGAAEVRSIGQRRDAAGYPVFRLAVGTAEVEDFVVPELQAGGVRFVRTITCVRGEVRVEAAARSGRVTVAIGSEPASARVLKAGESMVLRYSW